MTDADIKMITHSLGLPLLINGKRDRWSYRNYYSAAAGSPAYDRALALSGKGFMVPDRNFFNNGRSRLFFVTEKGARTAGVWGRVRKEDRV